MTEDTTLVAADIERIIAEYDRIVRLNTIPTYDAMAEVAIDRDGEVMYEVLDTANDLGFSTLISGEVDRLQDAADLYRARLLAEVGPARAAAVERGAQ